MKLKVRLSQQEYDVNIVRNEKGYLIKCGDREFPARIVSRRSNMLVVDINGVRHHFGKQRKKREVISFLEGLNYSTVIEEQRFTELKHIVRPAHKMKLEKELEAPIPGLITRILVEPGQEVKKNQSLLVLMAMKMENEIGAPIDGKIKDIHVEEGQAVDKGDILVRFE